MMTSLWITTTNAVRWRAPLTGKWWTGRLRVVPRHLTLSSQSKMSTSTSEVSPIVSTSWLKQNLNNPKVKTFDASLSYIAEAEEDYQRKHIPTALYFNLNRCINPTPFIPRNLPEVECFTEYARSLGINEDTHLVFYDSSTLHFSTKAWWIFRVFGHESVSVLDGGLLRWEHDGSDVSSDKETSKEEGNFQVRMNPSLLWTFEQTADAVKQQSAQIIDTRRKPNFLGKEPEPSVVSQTALRHMGMPIPDTMHSGCMKGAVHVGSEEFVDPKTGCFLPKDQMKKMFSDHGIDLDKPIVTTCYLGHYATLACMAAYICDRRSIPLYFGSWTEFAQRADADLVELRTTENL